MDVVSARQPEEWSVEKLQAPLWTPVLELVVSNQRAMICSAICHVPKVFFTVSASILPDKSPVLAMQRILLSSS